MSHLRNRFSVERVLLQLSILLAAGVAVGAGLGGALRGAGFFGLSGDVSADNHVRYLSGLLLGIGLAYWSTISKIEARGPRIRLLSCVVVCGGMVRLAGVIAVGVPNTVALFALVNEIVVPVLICLWQARLARGLRLS